MSAVWSTDDVEQSVTDGTLSVSLPLFDDGVLAGCLLVEMTAGRSLTVTWQGEPGMPALSNYRAWAKGGS